MFPERRHFSRAVDGAKSSRAVPSTEKASDEFPSPMPRRVNLLAGRIGHSLFRKQPLSLHIAASGFLRGLNGSLRNFL